MSRRFLFATVLLPLLPPKARTKLVAAIFPRMVILNGLGGAATLYGRGFHKVQLGWIRNGRFEPGAPQWVYVP